VSASLISNLVVDDTANATNWSVQSGLAAGATQYGDRTYTFRSVPSAVAGADWIRTANGSKAFTGATVATFTVTASADVYVAFNDAIATKPSWLSSYNDSGLNLVNSESTPKTFSLFKRTFTSGSTVTLGNGGSTASSFYTVIAAPAGSSPPPNTNLALPPKWVFGVLYGSYHDQAGVLSDMNMLRANYSGDLYWVDSSWLSSSYTGTPQDYICFHFDQAQFPDPATMIGTLRQNHLHFGVWEWPWMDKGCADYANGAKNHYFVENSMGAVVNAGGWHGNTMTGAFDYSNPATVTWWNSLNQPLVDMGLSFFKLDTGGTYPTGGVLFDGNNSQDHYKTLYRETAYNLSAKANGGRGFVMTHTQSSTNAVLYPGMWTNDTTATFAGLVAEMKTAASLNTTGTAAYWCGDTGGYNHTPTDELYIRWLEYTTFTPCQEFFGAKTTSTGARFPWMFGTQAQQIFQTYTQLRYRLLPFRYSNAQIAYHVSPAVYPVQWIGTTQIVNGSGNTQLLVQPITVAGQTSVSVAFPAGTWIDYWTGTTYSGGASHAVPAAIDKVPMFVKAGSIIPTGPNQQYVDSVPTDPLTLDIYPSGSTSYNFYEDDGVSAAYQTGGFSTTLLSCNQSGSSVTVTVGAAAGTYSGQPASRTYLLKVNGQTAAPAALTIGGAPATEYSSMAALNAATTGWFYDSTALIVWAKFPSTPTQATTVAF
jgi:alpha-glucosidase